MKREYRFDYEKYENIAQMPAADRELVALAREACGTAFAPYSNFKVGAAARLESGEILTGSNQESEVFPATMCAERTLLFDWQAHHANDPIETLVITSIPGEKECYPCGQCRQVLLDTERRQGKSIKVIMCSEGTASTVVSVKDLLPFQFEL